MRQSLCFFTLGLCCFSMDIGGGLGADEPAGKVIRAGMIGLDTSHVPAFTKIFNDDAAEGRFARVRIVAGYPGGTDLPASKDRVEGFTEQVREMGVEIVSSIDELLKKVDVVLIESVDGRIHLAEAIPVLLAGKPLFIDKPVAGSLADAIAIYQLAEKQGVPVFSSSSLRYSPTFQALLGDEGLGDIVGAITWGPCAYQEGTPDLFFYGVHGVEVLYTLMGTGCQTVTRVHTEGTDVVTGVWDDGRVGTFRGLRQGKASFGAVAFGTKGIRSAERSGNYRELCDEIAKFFLTGKPPIDPATTVELFTFMEAADESKRQGGKPVELEPIVKAATREAAGRLDELTRGLPTGQ